MENIMQNYFDEIVEKTAEILKFDSSLKEAEENCPFGKEAADCLAFFLNLAQEMGFETHNYDNYVGEVVYGEGKDFAILAHLDVVPAGNGWKYPPFGGVINDDVSDGGVTGTKIWGRGAMDDKTPAVVCLYALKALKDQGILPNRTVKLIVGCNEEAGWKCIDHYNKVAVMPEEGFTPDANFPVIYAEKGILHFTASFPINEAPMSALNAGERVNMVCDSASVILTRKAGGKLVNYENPIEGTRLSYDNTTNILRAYGKSAHGSTPECGANALQAVLYFLASFHEDCKKAYDALFDDVTGLKTLEDETGKLTISPDVATFKDGVLKITSDIRFPATLPLETVTAKLDEFGVEYVIDNYQPPIYNDPNGKLITALVGVYNKISGKNEEPIAIGGGTYARALKCGCAFGPEINGEEATIHQANEYVTFDRIRLMSDVYYNAIKEVCCAPAQKTEEKASGKIRIATRKIGWRRKEVTAEAAEEELFEEVIAVSVDESCDIPEESIVVAELVEEPIEEPIQEEIPILSPIAEEVMAVAVTAPEEIPEEAIAVAEEIPAEEPAQEETEEEAIAVAEEIPAEEPAQEETEEEPIAEKCEPLLCE